MLARPGGGLDAPAGTMHCERRELSTLAGL